MAEKETSSGIFGDDDEKTLASASSAVQNQQMDDKTKSGWQNQATSAGEGLNDAVSGIFGNAPWNQGDQEGNANNTGAITADEAAILNPGAVGLDEEFAGTGGISNMDVLEGRNRSHTEGGGDYTPDLGNPGDIPDPDGAGGRT